MKTELLIYITLCVFALILIQYNVNASDKEFVWTDSGALVIIENAQSSEITLDSEGAWDIKVEPSKTERTYIYGESGELTVIQPSSLGTFTY